TDLIIGLLPVAVAFLAQLLLWIVADKGPPPVLFVLAVAAAVWMGGFRAGILATACSALICAFLVLKYPLLVHIGDPFERALLISFAIFGIWSAAVLRKLRSARAEVERNSRRNEEILESIRDGFVALDAESRFTYANQAAQALMERPQSELLGQSL